MVAVYVGFRLYYGELAFLPGLFALLLAPEFFRPLRDLGAHYHARMDAIGATEGLLDILNTQPAEQPAAKALPANAPQEIRVEGLGYQHQQGAGIEDISFTLRRGETLAIVGASGAGKTTLARLLLRFISPATGQILIDGHNLSDLSLQDWQKQIGWLPSGRHYLPVLLLTIFVWHTRRPVKVSCSLPRSWHRQTPLSTAWPKVMPLRWVTADKGYPEARSSGSRWRVRY